MRSRSPTNRRSRASRCPVAHQNRDQARRAAGGTRFRRADSLGETRGAGLTKRTAAVGHHTQQGVLGARRAEAQNRRRRTAQDSPICWPPLSVPARCSLAAPRSWRWPIIQTPPRSWPAATTAKRSPVKSSRRGVPTGQQTTNNSCHARTPRRVRATPSPGADSSHLPHRRRRRPSGTDAVPLARCSSRAAQRAVPRGRGVSNLDPDLGPRRGLALSQGIAQAPRDLNGTRVWDKTRERDKAQGARRAAYAAPM